MKFSRLLLILYLSRVFVESCTNLPSTVVKIVQGSKTLKKTCGWVGLNLQYCSYKTTTGQLVNQICKKECLLSCRPTAAPIKPPTRSPTRMPTKRPTQRPTRRPTKSPSRSPTRMPTKRPTRSPTRMPTKPPTRAPTRLPTKAPTSSFIPGPYPSGPYITPATNSKKIVLPDPPVPGSSASRTGCPHQDANLKDWNNPTTWGGSIPVANQDVTIPASTRVLVSSSVVNAAGLITIPASSELIIGENVGGISLSAKGFNVLGKLTVGSETCKVETPVIITLVGARPATAVTSPPAPTVKGISVAGGTLNLHGKQYYQTWARLAKTVQVGDRAIVLQRPVNWERGQKIVLVTSSIKDDRTYNRNEVVTVDGIHPSPPAGVGAIVYLQQATAYQHLANEYYQVEVGLLTRMIKIQGSADSEPSDPETFNCMGTYYSWQLQSLMSQPCTTKASTGYGGHVMVHNGGKGYVEGVELFRMGQTNVVHGTNNATVSENVAYDVTGYCYYLEDGVEEFNTLSFNLAAHIHTLGPNMPWGDSQSIDYLYDETDVLTLPADVTASGFYITNIHNYIKGNAASGGWAGFAFPSLATPLGPHRNEPFRPSNKDGLVLDGNTAHSTGFWWDNAGAFYFGGALFYKADGKLRYDAGRSFDFKRDSRRPCKINQCLTEGWAYEDACAWSCPTSMEAWPLMSNTKTFLVAGVGLNSWTGRMDVVGYESYDSRLAAESLTDSGFWIDQMLVVCRTGNHLGLPSGGQANRMEGSGFYWYDTAQAHIITNAEFKNCGYRSSDFAQYDSSPLRGCGDDLSYGCRYDSTVFGLLTHSDEFTPEVMQGTKGIVFTSCGRRFKFTSELEDTVSGRGQNWLDADGTVSGLGEPTLIGSGLESAKSWWRVDNQVVLDEQGPMVFIKQNNGPARAIGHMHMSWDPSLHDQVGYGICGNGDNSPCPAVGYVRHLGHMFSPARNPNANLGLPVTANPDIVGPVGGFGWVLKLSGGAPRSLDIDQVEMDPSKMLLLSIAYPVGTVFAITAKQEWCWEDSQYKCTGVFQSVNSVAAVRSSLGNTYYVNGNGVLTFRVFQQARLYNGNPNWFFPTYDTIQRDDPGYAVPRFEREGVVLPDSTGGTWLQIRATCGGTGIYCSGTVIDYDPNVCDPGYIQVAYDTCCSTTNPSQCKYADGSVS